jgi:hypothetical protein
MATSVHAESAVERLLSGKFQWKSTPPFATPLDRDGGHYFSVKDPSIVRSEKDNRWHMFCTVRGEKRSHQIEYFAFADFTVADRSDRHFLTITDGYFCAPQVFYFTPHKKWYLIYQVWDKREGVKWDDRAASPGLEPAFSTNDDIADWKAWTAPQRLFDAHPENIRHWIDFWVICDEQHAYLFCTSNDGKMWRSRTRIEDFPKKWSAPEIALKHPDLFEASHTYRIQGAQKYLTIVESRGDNRRFYQAFLADKLDGTWTPLAVSRAHPFASDHNVHFPPDSIWAQSISHGELLRSSNDERMEIDPANFRMVYQGVRDEEMKGKSYGQIPWRLGLLISD